MPFTTSTTKVRRENVPETDNKLAKKMRGIMAKVEASFQNDQLEFPVNKEGKFDGFLILSAFPEGKGSLLEIAGYRFPFAHEFIKPVDPTDARPRVVIDTAKLDVPIELLVGEEVRLV